MRNDEEAERAVERWVRIGDEVAGKKGGVREDQARRLCASCGTIFNVLASDGRGLCARCFLERGETSRTF